MWENLWDDTTEEITPIPDDYSFDAKKYPPLSTAEVGTFKSYLKKNNECSGIEDLDDVLSSINLDMSKVAYVVCEKKSFRAEALRNALSDFYKTSMYCILSDGGDTDFEDALCFVVDLASASIDRAVLKILGNIQSVASKSNVPIFLIGDSEDHAKILKHLNKHTARIVCFGQPFNLKERIDDIVAVLSSPIEEKKRHLFIVDDSSVFLKLAQKTLEGKYYVTTADSAYDAIAKLAVLGENDRPDLFILDFRMPIVNGKVLCQMLRERDEFKNTPVIFYSGNDSKDVNEIIQLMSVGIEGYVLKSEPITSLENYIEGIFEKIETKQNGGRGYERY